MKRLAAVSTSFFLAACATAYKPNSFWNDGGFAETEIQPNLFQVKFAGNEFTNADRTADLAMLRAADLCIGRGMPYMFLGDVATQIVAGASIPGSSTTKVSANVHGYGNSAYVSGTAYTTTTPSTQLYRPESGLTVSCTAKGANGAWDASFLSRSLRSKYKIESN